MTTPADDEKISILYFGDRWDSPYLDPEPDRVVAQHTTPVGTPCYGCEEAIATGDRGLFRPVVRAKPGGKADEWIGELEPVHAECDLRAMLGSPAHLRGQCRCVGRDEPPYPGSRREEAVATVAILNEQRAGQGLGPLW